MKKVPYKFFILSLLILFFALFAPVNGKQGGPSFDKIAHILLFAFVSMNACFYFLANKKSWTLSMIFVCLLPITTEYFQTFIPGRNFENLDIFADLIGIGVGVISYFLFKTAIVKIYHFFGENQDKVIGKYDA